MIIYLKQCGAKLKNRVKNFLQEGCKRSSLQPHFDVLHVSIRRQQCRVSQHVTEAARQGRLGFWVGRTGDVATSTSNHIAQMSLRVSRLFFVRPRFSIPDAATAMAGGDHSKKDAPATGYNVVVVEEAGGSQEGAAAKPMVPSSHLMSSSSNLKMCSFLLCLHCMELQLSFLILYMSVIHIHN